MGDDTETVVAGLGLQARLPEPGCTWIAEADQVRWLGPVSSWPPEQDGEVEG